MRSARQERILSLIEEEDIGTQEELAARLIEEGFAVTQGTVSRDIRSLGLVKRPGSGGRGVYVNPGRPDEAAARGSILADAVSTVETSGNMLVIKTLPGMAMAAASVLDSLEWPEILGCIAGDDTILGVLRQPSDASRVKSKIAEACGVK